jgi:hypothetical protein
VQYIVGNCLVCNVVTSLDKPSCIMRQLCCSWFLVLQQYVVSLQLLSNAELIVSCCCLADLQCKFDLHSPQSTAAVPPVYYCTLDGAFCAAQDAAAAAAAEAAMQGSSWAEDSSGSGGLVAEVLHQESCAICSFDVESAYGRSILAATADEHLLLLHMDDSQMQQM